MLAWRRSVAFALGLGLFLGAPAAGATVIEPNGWVVPTDQTGGGEMRLDQFFISRGEPVHWRDHASEIPAVFSPLCGFRATLMRVDSGSKFGVGWYNVDPAATTPPTAVFPIIPRNAAPGTTFSGEDIRSSPNYTGGLIGFALIREGASPPYHYSEHHWNTQCTLLCNPPGPWKLALVYKSGLIPNAWYMGFEDGNTTASGWSNDGDFNDSLFLFEGLACAGAGEPCIVDGRQGICADGLTECDALGQLQCAQTTPEEAERCDAIDNDCNGLTDEGDLCESNEICHQGKCIPRCGSGEFLCNVGRECVDGVCVDTACANVTCPDGQSCYGGQCVAPCGGVVCPGAAVCRAGRCVDPCDGAECADGRVCEGGVCVESCDCRGCPSGEVCAGPGAARAGHCVAAGCELSACAVGEMCSATTGGQCAPACDAGVVCPRGQACLNGRCEVSDAATTGGATGTGGGTGFFAGGGQWTGPTASGGAAGGDTTGSGARSARNGDSDLSRQNPGCGCRAAGGSPVHGWGLAALLAGALGRRRRPHVLTDRSRTR